MRIEGLNLERYPQRIRGDFIVELTYVRDGALLTISRTWYTCPASSATTIRKRDLAPVVADMPRGLEYKALSELCGSVRSILRVLTDPPPVAP